MGVLRYIIYFYWLNYDFNEFEWSITSEDCPVWYADTDGDGLGDLNSPITACSEPEGYVTNSDDCDDTDPSITLGDTWFADTDGDGFGDPDDSQTSCDQPAGYVSNPNDCDDADATIGEAATWYEDADGDGFGELNITEESCTQPEGYVDNGDDCDDTDANVYPGAPAKPDGKDNDCDGNIDKLSQTIIFPAIDAQANGSTILLGATSDSGLEISYEVEGPATLNGSDLTITGEGKVLIKAKQEGNDGYEAAAEIEQEFCVNPTPEITSTPEGEFSLTLNSNYTEGNQWYLEGTAIEEATGSTHEVLSAGGYTLKVTLEGCVGTSEEYQVSVTSIEDIQGIQVDLYPNPVMNNINLKLQGLEQERVLISVTDVQGRIQKTRELNIGETSSTILDTSEFEPGIYFILIQSGDQVIKEKFVKQ